MNRTNRFLGQLFCWLLVVNLLFGLVPDLNHSAKFVRGFLPLQQSETPENCPFCQYNNQAGAAVSGEGAPTLDQIPSAIIPEHHDESNLYSSFFISAAWARPPPAFA
ncbi:MAG: hypothetical protein HQM09_04350 [Candidatus Riflebacteria bacterium]|nr:hypothetical protein [Candidatus Riflebacteria bacterium]